MEDFTLEPAPAKQDNDGTLDMSVSSICQKDGCKVAYVTFKDATRTAEGMIPMCEIIRNEGFSATEVRQLETYMQNQLPTLKKMAAGINVFDAFRGKK